MPKISISSLRKEIFCSEGKQTILAAIQENSIDWMHACGARGRCTTCSVYVIQGREFISTPSKSESFYRERNLLGANERLACQCTLTGDIEINIPESNRLPHLEYYD